LKICGKMPPPRENAYNLGVYPSKVTKLDAYKCWEFRKNIANESPLKYKFLAKLRIFLQFWGLYSHISAPINVKFGTGSGHTVRSPVPNFTFIGATCRPCGAKNRFLDLLSKNNTGMAALLHDCCVCCDQSQISFSVTTTLWTRRTIVLRCQLALLIRSLW